MKPIRCIFGHHTGQREGGTMMYTCPRCGESHWQKGDYSAVTRHADALIDSGRCEEAKELVRDALRDA